MKERLLRHRRAEPDGTRVFVNGVALRARLPAEWIRLRRVGRNCGRHPAPELDDRAGPRVAAAFGARDGAVNVRVEEREGGSGGQVHPADRGRPVPVR